MKYFVELKLLIKNTFSNTTFTVIEPLTSKTYCKCCFIKENNGLIKILCQRSYRFAIVLYGELWIDDPDPRQKE